MVAILFIFLGSVGWSAPIEVDDFGRVKKRAQSSRAQVDDIASGIRGSHRMGVGLKSGGGVGPLGFHLDLNLNPKTTLAMAASTLTEFQAYQVEIRNILTGQKILPYYSYGFSYWDPSRNGSLLSQQSLADFDSFLLSPAVGVQYQQTQGPWRGASVSVEAVILLSLQRLQSVPVGSMSLSYFF